MHVHAESVAGYKVVDDILSNLDLHCLIVTEELFI